MRPKKILAILLFLPYLGWVFALLLLFNNSISSELFPPFLMPLVAGGSLVYGIGILYWGIPYTVLLVGFLIWGKNKSWQKMYKAAAYLPFVLASFGYALALILQPIGVVSSIANSQFDIGEALSGAVNLAWYATIAGVTIVIYGYFFVGLAKLIFVLLDFNGLVNYDKDPKNELSFEQAMADSYNELKKLQ